jgi:hypothetical protein
MIREDETEIIGNWIEVDGRIVGDDACERVQLLTQYHLVKMNNSPESGGWETLFCDRKDGRFWERTYPHSDWHGGGPPALINLSEAEAKTKYPQLFD